MLRPTRGEGYLTPYELPASKYDVTQQLEGAQISGVEWNPEPLPLGWSGMGLELRSSAILLIFAAPVLDDPPFRTRLVFRWLAQHEIMTKSMERRLLGHDSASQPKDFLQRQIVGQQIVGVAFRREVNEWGGETVTVEFTQGEGMHVSSTVDPRHPLAAQMDVQVYGPERSIFGPIIAPSHAA